MKITNQLIQKCKSAILTVTILIGFLSFGSLIGLSGHATTVYSYNNNREIGRVARPQVPGTISLPHARAAIAMDAQTGRVLYQKNANQPRLVASTGKLMDLYLTWRKINRTPNAWSQQVRINHNLRRMSYDPDDGGYHFRSGHHYTVGNLMKAGIIASSNNAAIALGQWVGHTNLNFLRMENKQAHLWHLNAHFVSASGLENDDLARYGYWTAGPYYGGNEISAKDLAVIAYHIIHDCPRFLKYSRIGDMHQDGQNMYNYNELLPSHPFYQRGLHVDGLKTGWTPAAGFCFVGTAKWPHRDRIITVTLHDNHEWRDNAKLIRYVYHHFNLSHRK